MANSELYNKTFNLPPDVLKHIERVLVSNPTGDGVKRAKFMLKNGSITYQSLKRLKNFFDYFNPQKQSKLQYELAGGNEMKSFVDKTLNQERAGVKRSKELKTDINFNPNSELNAHVASPKLNEEKGGVKKNAIAVIVDKDNKFLLLKRSDEPKQWMPSKWALVGGGVEKDESPEEACKREVKEETGLEIDKFIKTFSIQRNPNSIEYIFACRFTGDPTDITLNDENTNYGWYDISEMEFLDTVPNLIEYITLTFKKYE
jgi:8-oxo-dGTP diphosphatase